MDEPVFVDTNVFLRFFVRDVEHFYLKARKLFEKAEEGMVRLETSDLVIAEIVWVLESYYAFTRAEIHNVLDTILETRNIRLANSPRIVEALKLYASGKMDFIDAYTMAYIKAKNLRRVATFDVKHFKNVEGLQSIW